MQVLHLISLFSALTLGSCASVRLNALRQECGETVSLDFSGEVPQVTCSSTCPASDMQTWSVGSIYKKPAALVTFGLMVKMDYSPKGISCTLVESKSDSSLFASFLDESGVCESALITTESQEAVTTGTASVHTEVYETANTNTDITPTRVTSATDTEHLESTPVTGEGTDATPVEYLESTPITGEGTDATPVEYLESTPVTGEGTDATPVEYLESTPVTGEGTDATAVEYLESTPVTGEGTDATGGAYSRSTVVTNEKTTNTAIGTDHTAYSTSTPALSIEPTATDFEVTTTAEGTAVKETGLETTESGTLASESVNGTTVSATTAPIITMTSNVATEETPIAEEETTMLDCAKLAETDSPTDPPTTTTSTSTSTTTTSTTTTTTTTTTPAPVWVCPTGFTRYGDSCYHISAEKGSWETGDYYCKSKGSTYVTITSEGEQNFVKSLLKESVWIGYNDKAKESQFKWASGEPNSVYSAFAKGEPNDGGFFKSTEDCVEMRQNLGYYWNDESCSTWNKYACETGLVLQQAV